MNYHLTFDTYIIQCIIIQADPIFILGLTEFFSSFHFHPQILAVTL